MEHSLQSPRSLCSRCFAVQNFKILNSCQNKWMHELLYQNEWVAIFYHYYDEVYHANVCKIQNSSFMQNCVFLLRPHKWLDFNDALIFFFLFRILYLNGVNFQHCIYNLLHVDSWKCNIFRAQSTDWNYSSGAHSTKRAELKAASE